MEGVAGEGEEGVGGEAGAGAVGLPLVAEEAGVGVDVAEGAGVLRAGEGGAVLGVGAVGVLGPEAVEDEAQVLGALAGGGVGLAELGRPGEVEEVVVEVAGGGFGLLRGVGGGSGCGLRKGERGGGGIGSAGYVDDDGDEDEGEDECGFLHAKGSVRLWGWVTRQEQSVVGEQMLVPFSGQ